MRDLLEKWRHLIEPVIQASATPLAWDVVLTQPLQVFEGERTVLVTRPGSLNGKPAWYVWVAAGDFDEVPGLFERVKESARTAGMDQVAYMGRRGWIRAMGFDEVAVIAVKEL